MNAIERESGDFVLEGQIGSLWWRGACMSTCREKKGVMGGVAAVLFGVGSDIGVAGRV